jgi:hypothetical protein
MGFSPLRFEMSRTSKNSMTATVLLILLGLAALFAGTESLVVLIPAAILIWYSSRPFLQDGRN